jgi:enoyl-CoA hydratase/carnithine racemase
MYKLIELNKINSHLTEVILNRPEKLNAMTKPMWIELGKIFKKLSKNKI